MSDRDLIEELSHGYLVRRRAVRRYRDRDSELFAGEREHVDRFLQRVLDEGTGADRQLLFGLLT